MAEPSDRFAEEIAEFIDYLTIERGLAENTLTNYARDLRQCAEALREVGRRSFTEATYPELAAHLNDLRQKRGLSPKTISRRQYALRAFYRFLEAEGRLDENPALRIEPLKTWKDLPDALTLREVERLLKSLPRDADPYSLRRRAIVELLYATGLRVSEMTSLRLDSLRPEIGYLECIGKGNKQRIVPLGDWAYEAVREWIDRGRPRLLNGAESDFLFINRGGKPMARQHVWAEIRKCAAAAGIGRRLSPHTLRHSFATHLLHEGIDLRALQEMLGHADISMTQLYTKIEPEHLKKALREFHPRG